MLSHPELRASLLVLLLHNSGLGAGHFLTSGHSFLAGNFPQARLRPDTLLLLVIEEAHVGGLRALLRLGLFEGGLSGPFLGERSLELGELLGAVLPDSLVNVVHFSIDSFEHGTDGADLLLEAADLADGLLEGNADVDVDVTVGFDHLVVEGLPLRVLSRASSADLLPFLVVLHGERSILEEEISKPSQVHLLLGQLLATESGGGVAAAAGGVRLVVGLEGGGGGTLHVDLEVVVALHLSDIDSVHCELLIDDV